MNEKQQGEPVETLDKRWKAVSALIFKEDVGGLSGYAAWLLENTEPLIHRVSSISGKPVTYIIPEYAKNSRWADFNETGKEKETSLPDSGEPRSIETVLRTPSKYCYYVGNVVLGSSGFVQRSSNITDSFYVYESGRFGDSRYIAYSTMGRFGEDCFGCNGIGESSFCIKCSETYKEKRTFEVWMSQNCSDCYYSFGLNNCTECMFCFHLKNKRYAIGNLELEPARYYELKNRLLLEMAAELKRNKRLPSLVELVRKSSIMKPKLPFVQDAPQQTSKAPVEEAFSKTCRLVFGTELRGNIDDYSVWLGRHVQRKETGNSALSGRILHLGDYCNYFSLPRDRLIAPEESLLLGEHAKFSEHDLDDIQFSNMHERIGKIAFFAAGYREGASANIIEDPVYISSSNCYRTIGSCYSKYCSYSFWPRSSQYAFGCANLFESQFCINCYYSVKLTRCFEMDSSRGCSDCYFCHNCENLQDCMFCFNTKNKRYAIGNVEVGKEKFGRLKTKFFGELIEKLKSTRNLEPDIFNICSQIEH